jgi:hypothetical protein
MWMLVTANETPTTPHHSACSRYLETRLLDLLLTILDISLIALLFAGMLV